ncbi:hypothetical protein RRG08_007712 [Elysia crispata]|uniref:Uncharacterized protein n=1 Tax=Elysia crispata TaxID=231223 RepID=A0AAE0YL21_9GAST|nr:hypothetical protein RRG08_007712 [Elysia crispata]
MILADSGESAGGSGLTKPRRKHSHQSSGNSPSQDSGELSAVAATSKRKRKSCEQTSARGKSGSPASVDCGRLLTARSLIACHCYSLPS